MPFKKRIRETVRYSEQHSGYPYRLLTDSGYYHALTYDQDQS